MKNLFDTTIANVYDLFFIRKIDEPKFYKLKFGDNEMFRVVLFPDGSVGYVPKSAYFGLQAIPYVREDGVKGTKYRDKFDLDKVLDYADFFDKGYAFFRYCMDENIDDDEIISLIKFMIEKNINDSRDLNAEFWDDFSARYNHGEIRDLLEFSSDMINIPDLMDYIKYFNNVILLGGGITECLKEVELAFMALNKPYNILKEFTY